MISKIIYKELPIEDIAYLNREEFTENGLEKSFYQNLKQSIAKNGIKDPVYIVYGDKAYGDILKVIVGNNRMVIAKTLGIKTIPSIINNLKSDTYSIE
jgi:ParB-like chromosome segregation protein Spo0J